MQGWFAEPFWCELSNFILREGMSYLNFVRFNQMPENGMKRLTENQMLVLPASWDIINKHHNKRHWSLAGFTGR